MYAEYSGLVLTSKGYMDSSVFTKLLEEIKTLLDDEVSKEHALFTLGKTFLESKKRNESHLENIKKMLGDDWNAVRFRNLVRLGADIENSGLGSLSRATLVGAFLYQKEKLLGG